jgi:hypothetical protein
VITRNLPLFLVTLRRNVKSQEIVKLNKLNYIIIEVESYRIQTGLGQCYNSKTLAMAEPTVSFPLDVCGLVVTTCTGNAPKEEYRMYAYLLLLHLSRRRTYLPGSYRGCSHAKGEIQRRRFQQAPKGSSGIMLFSNFTSPQQS